jgi:hypothetical protein
MALCQPAKRRVDLLVKKQPKLFPQEEGSNRLAVLFGNHKPPSK